MTPPFLTLRVGLGSCPHCGGVTLDDLGTEGTTLGPLQPTAPGDDPNRHTTTYRCRSCERLTMAVIDPKRNRLALRDKEGALLFEGPVWVEEARVAFSPKPHAPEFLAKVHDAAIAAGYTEAAAGWFRLKASTEGLHKTVKLVGEEEGIRRFLSVYRTLADRLFGCKGVPR